MAQSWPRRLWYGAALSTLFFYPLVTGLADGAEYFQWRRADSLELLTAFVLVAVLSAGLLRAVEAVANPHLQLSAALLVCALPFASFGTRLMRQLEMREALVSLADGIGQGSAPVVAGLALAAAAVLAVCVLVPGRVTRALFVTVAVLSPLTLLSGMVVARRSATDTIVEIRSVGPAGQGGGRDADGAELADLLVVVFDELDYGYLYEDGEVRPRFPHIRRFSDSSDNYHRATSPAPMTIPSMLGLLSGWRELRLDFDGAGNLYEMLDGLSPVPLPLGRAATTVFARGRRLGYHTALYGWGLPYCNVLVGGIDSCRSFSSYNFSDATRGFAPLSPVRTTLILWPLQRPFGWFKALASLPYQQERVQQTYALAVSKLSFEGPLLQVVHLSIPHAPFAFDGTGYLPARRPFLQDAVNYTRQLDYVDRLFGEYLAQIAVHRDVDAATIVLLSDHAYRSQSDPDTHQRIPLIVKGAGQSARRDLLDAVGSESVLEALITDPR